MEKFFFFLILSLFPPFILATTPGEVSTAAGMEGTLQGTVQSQPKEALNKVKQIVQEHEQVQQEKDLANAQAIEETQQKAQEHAPGRQERAISNNQAPPVAAPDAEAISPPPEEENPAHPLFEEDSLLKDIRDLTKEEFEERLQDDINQDTKPVDYTSPIQIFYKRKCASNQANCNRGAVLTNIRSVIFDYAHTRGSFAESK